MHNKKKVRCGFEPAKMHWDFYSITNAFQMIFDAISNFICYEGHLTCFENTITSAIYCPPWYLIPYSPTFYFGYPMLHHGLNIWDPQD